MLNQWPRTRSVDVQCCDEKIVSHRVLFEAKCREITRDSRLLWLALAVCNMCTCSGNRTQEWAVQDLLCLVDLYLVYLI